MESSRERELWSELKPTGTWAKFHKAGSALGERKKVCGPNTELARSLMLLCHPLHHCFETVSRKATVGKPGVILQTT